MDEKSVENARWHAEQLVYAMEYMRQAGWDKDVQVGIIMNVMLDLREGNLRALAGYSDLKRQIWMALA